MAIKTFRGLIADDSVETIHLSTNDGSIGYKIKKFEGMSNRPGAADSEHVLKIYKISQPLTTVDGVVNFGDNTLIGALYFTNRTDTLHSNENVIISDLEIFNQDIFITHADVRGSESANYYIELESMKLDLNENTVVTLKDIRNTNSN